MQRLSRTLIQLNIATREHHVAADAPWLDLMVPTVDRGNYKKHLVNLYGFETALEAALHYTPGLNALVDLRARARSGLIVQDLMSLGLSAVRIAGLPQRFTTFASAPEALAWMYVAERPALLHGVVRRYLTLRMPELLDASSYLSAGNSVAATRWNELGDALDAIAYTPSIKRQIARAANDGFIALCEWFDDCAALQSVGT